jgi:aryl-alcohol dehydrogenase-like predicted oxidoreductase
MPLDHYVSLGRSGLRVSPFCLGTMTFGTAWGFGTDEANAATILDLYLDQGGNFVDTANIYNKGESEQILGNYFSREPAKRERTVLATKFGGNTVPGDPNSAGGSRKAIIAACDASLRRLQTDYIDLYWQHWEDPFAPMEETLRALDDLVRAGKIRYVGYSDTSAWRVATAHTTALFQGWEPLAAIQVEYSLLERTSDGELLPMARAFGMGVTSWGPLASGVLTGKHKRGSLDGVTGGRAASLIRYANDDTYGILDALAPIARKYGTTVGRIALAWVHHRPGITSALLGARSVEQLIDNLAALELVLDPEDIAVLDAVSEPKLNFPAALAKNTHANTYTQMHVNGRDYGAAPMSDKK